MVDKERLAEVLIESAQTLVSSYRVDETLQRLCDRVVEVLPVTGAGVMLDDEAGDLRFVAASDDTVRQIEGLQIELGEGPCLHAYQTGESVIVADLEDGEWFPRFAPKAIAAGLRAVYSFPMRHEQDRIGALNLYRAEPGMFADEDRVAGQTLADVATATILNGRQLAQSERITGQLQRALESRVVIEQAKGRLAERHGIAVSEAFELLRRHARRNSRKLHDVARDVVHGTLDIGAS